MAPKFKIMKNVLIFSNCAASETESNGRIHMTHFEKFLEKDCLHNFYIRGNPDYKNISYANISYKDAFLSKITFGIKKPSINTNTAECGVNVGSSFSEKSSNPFYHFARNWCYSNNRTIFDCLCEYVKINNINFMVIWGSNVPFLYQLIRKVSKKTGIKYITITCEDYPLKKYCYFKKKNIFFYFFQKQLKNECIKCYKNSAANIYCNEDLKEIYEKNIGLDNGEVIYLGSSLPHFIINKDKKIKSVLYGGSLNNDRVNSIIDVAEIFKKRDIILNIYGKTDNTNIERFSKFENIRYHGVVSFKELIEHYYENDALLHVEGFSENYINDCRYAFSTKISDYLVSGKKMIVYGPKDISGIKFLYSRCKEIVAITKSELFDVIDYLESDSFFSNDLYKEFETCYVSKKIMKIIELI